MPPVSPLDESEWEAPHTIAGLGFGPELNSNNILWYFMNSTFFDPMCNNKAFVDQKMMSGQREVFFDRHVFEAALQKEYPTGVQYLVTAEPKEPGQPWVIQRQNRTRNTEPGTEGFKTEVQGVYYTVGTKFLMAPNLRDVVQSRLLSVSSLIQEVFETAQSLTHWSPATGHTYIPPTYESTTKPTFSRAGSIAPDASIDPSSQLSTNQQPAENQITEFSDDFFLQSLMLTNKYGHEYMDENPLQGEPGNFVFASTNEALEARNKKQEATAHAPAVPVKPVEGESAVNSVAPTPKNLPLEAMSRKESVAGLSKIGKEKRRKSKGLTSPISPTGTGP